MAPATTAPTSVFSQPTFDQSAFGTSAQAPGIFSPTKPASGFEAYVGGGMSGFASGGTSTTTNPPAGGGSAFPPLPALSHLHSLLPLPLNQPAGLCLAKAHSVRRTLRRLHHVEGVPLEHRHKHKEEGSLRLRTYRLRPRRHQHLANLLRRQRRQGSVNLFSQHLRPPEWAALDNELLHNLSFPHSANHSSLQRSTVEVLPS
ncbi:hypothetical protein BKA70DRAFT_1256348 [Coprinopsis sp. MPI-PUGE-AT-0042]|nr:hypothetical protein BKA70DRAFT_1256348 [Coprinopsis sp. MPI-PUGE-AT-0042]